MQATPAQPHRPEIAPKPMSTTTPTKPSANPAARLTPNCSCTPNERDNSTTHIGTVAMRMPVTEELIHCSPSEMAAKGTTNSTSAKATSAPPWARNFGSAPRFHAIGTRIHAASPTQTKGATSGEISATASLMKKYGTPQMTLSAANAVQTRQPTFHLDRSRYRGIV